MPEQDFVCWVRIDWKTEEKSYQFECGMMGNKTRNSNAKISQALYKQHFVELPHFIHGESEIWKREYL